MSTMVAANDNQDYIPPGQAPSSVAVAVYVGRQTRAQKRRLDEIERDSDPLTAPDIKTTTEPEPTPTKLKIVTSPKPHIGKKAKSTKKRAPQATKARTARVEQKVKATTQKKLGFVTKKIASASLTVDLKDRKIIPESTKTIPLKGLPKHKPAVVKQTSIPSQSAVQVDHDEEEDMNTIVVDNGLVHIAQLLTQRKPPGSRPPAQGQPAVWATGRQEMCETLPYYRAHHGACYVNKGVVYSFMLDGGGQIREYMDENVIICRAGGGMESEKGSTLQCKNQSLQDSQPQAVLNNILHQNPLVIICGDRNAASPVDMPHRYCVLGWYKPTHVWAEMMIGKAGKSFVSVKYRFERLDQRQPAWYAPVTPALAEDQEQVIPPLETQVCTSCSKAWPTAMLSGWMCLNPSCQQFSLLGGKLAPNTLQYNPSFLRHETPWPFQAAPFDINPGVPQPSNSFGNNLAYINTRGIVCPQCGRCNQRYLFTGWKCDTRGCDWSLSVSYQGYTHRNLRHDPWDIVSDGPALTKSTSKAIVKVEVKHTHNYKVSKYTIPGVEGCIVHAKANRAVIEESSGPDEMFKALQVEDIGLIRRTFVKDSAVKQPQVKSRPEEESQPIEEADNEDAAPQLAVEPEPTSGQPARNSEECVVKRASSQPPLQATAQDAEMMYLGQASDSTATIFDMAKTKDMLKRLALDLPANANDVSSYERTSGTQASVFGIAQAKAILKGLALDLSNKANDVSKNVAVAGRASSLSASTFQSTELKPVDSSVEPGEPADGEESPDVVPEPDTTQSTQEGTTMADEADNSVNDGRMQSFSNNFGMPYKFVAGVDSQSFDESAWPIRACRSRLNWALRTLLGETDPKKQFNELLAIGYLERQKISYHDDGEAGLGPVIATLSLGSAATMTLRLKGKYFSSVSKAECFTYERPLPLEVIQSSTLVASQRISQAQYDERIEAFEELQTIKETKGKNFMQRSRELPKDLGLKFKLAQPLLDLHLTHGDIVIMQGEDIQKYFEHAVEPHGSLRFALTCRQILAHHLTDSQKPTYEVGPDTYGYNGQQIRREGDSDILQW